MMSRKTNESIKYRPPLRQIVEEKVSGNGQEGVWRDENG